MNELILLILRQTAILFANVEETINAIDENRLCNSGSWGWPIGEQLYHLLHSLDQWFVNPYDYEEPSWLGQDLKSSSGSTGRKLSKIELMAYYTSIKSKIEHYLGTLDDQSLKDYPKDCKFARLELILGQYRHLMYHIGLIHGCLRSETGRSPEYIGLDMPIAQGLTQ
jgi:hypothetical protein